MRRVNDPCEIMDSVIDLARHAGRKIMKFYKQDVSIEHKEDRTPLTEADLAAHNTIVAGLSELTPGIPILSEESADIPFEERSQWDCYWLVDPLDGTREFIKHNGEFTVNIALIENHRPVLGVIVVPVSGLCYYACTGQGAYKQQPDNEPVSIKVRPYDPGHTVIAGSRSHGSEKMDEFLTKIGECQMISMGSSLKSCLVAEGKADLYPRFGPTSEWDTAAAHCIVEQAGGELTDLQMKTLRYNTKESLLNPPFLVIGDNSYDWSVYLPG